MKKTLLPSIAFMASLFSAKAQTELLTSGAITGIDTWFANSSWTQETESTATLEGGKITVNIRVDKAGQWQGQVKVQTTVTKFDTSKQYDFACKMTANKNVGGVTVKVMDNNAPVMEVVDLTAGVNNLKFTNCEAAGADCNGIIVFDFGWASAGTDIVIESLSLVEHEAVIPDVTPYPTVAAPVPTLKPEQVKALYSESYELAPATFNSYCENWGQSTSLQDRDVEGNHFLYYKNFNYIGWQFAETDFSDMNYLHINLFSPTTGSLRIVPIYGGAGKTTNDNVGKVLSVKEYEWVSYDIPLTDFAGLDFSSIFQVKFDNGSNVSQFSLDNVFFWKGDINGIDKPQTAADETVFDLTGRRVATPEHGIYVKNGKKFLVK